MTLLSGGPPTIEGVRTGTALFIGASGAGPLDAPALILSHGELVATFGDDETPSTKSSPASVQALLRQRWHEGIRHAHRQRTPVEGLRRTPTPVPRRELDHFDLLVLPACKQAGGCRPQAPVGPGQRLLSDADGRSCSIDPPSTWTDHTDPVEGKRPCAGAAIADHQAAPLVRGSHRQATALPRSPDRTRPASGRHEAAGSIAGLMARIDSGTRGVEGAPPAPWPMSAAFRGVRRAFSADEIGYLAHGGINTDPSASRDHVVSWGARTMDGDDDFGSECKVRAGPRAVLLVPRGVARSRPAGRTALEAQRHGELWSAVRLNVGNFLHRDLFRQPAPSPEGSRR